MLKNLNEDTALAKWKPRLDCDVFVVDRVLCCNYRPSHPFTIGVRHIADAADHHSGMLGRATLEAIPCAHRDCNLTLDKHTHDVVLVLMPRRSCSKDELHAGLKAAFPPGISAETEADGIDGLIFIKNPDPTIVVTGMTDKADDAGK